MRSNSSVRSIRWFSSSIFRMEGIERGLNEAAAAALKLLQEWECQQLPRRRSAPSNK